MSVFYKLSIKEIAKETKNAVSVNFEVPENLQDEFNFIPGQYLTLQKELGGHLLRRAYSICSSINSKDLKVAIKEVNKGAFSQYANNELSIGDTIDVAAPEGKFILNTSKNNNKNYLAFVAGSGITPVLSMIKSVLEIEDKSKFVLVYGNKSSELTIFKNEIDKLANKYENQFEVHYVFSQKISDKASFGRINLKVINDILKHKYNQVSFDEYFLCGPEDMIDLVKETLLKNGIKSDLIKFELFTISSNKKEVNTELSGNSEITILLDDEEITFDMRKDELILNAALAHDLDAPYSCQGGICSSCLARIIEGEVVMDNNTILDTEEIEEGLILTCQAHPISSTIKIDYDDV
jgi:ring-1,2-phenylacetyl-CoA epoxidase subunit PaaE